MMSEEPKTLVEPYQPRVADIIEFPKAKIVRVSEDEAQPNEQVEEMKAKGLQKYAESIIQSVAGNVIEELEHCGLDVDSDEFNKDFHFSMYVLSSSIFRTMDLPHPMHDFLDSQVKLIASPEDLENFVRLTSEEVVAPTDDCGEII